MTLHAKRLARHVVTGAVILAALVEPLIGATAAHAATAKSPAYFDRKAVIGRAARWTGAGVPYSQTSWRDDYRTDCSGLVSYAWGLDQSYVTWSLPEIAKPIHKEELQPGDILLNLWKHVVIFGGWANTKHTAYVVYEEAGSPHRAVKRVVAYPYDSGSVSLYKPYRYTGGHSLFAPENHLPGPLVQSYAGGKPIVPSFAYAKNTARSRIAEKHAIERLNRIHAAQRAQAKAAAARKAAAAKALAAKQAAKAAADRAAGAKAQEASRAAAAAKAERAESQKPVVVQLLNAVLAFLQS